MENVGARGGTLVRGRLECFRQTLGKFVGPIPPAPVICKIPENLEHYYPMQILRTRMYRGPKPPNRRRALVLCDCGNKFFTWLSAIKSGNTTSCGCKRATRLGTTAKQYGEAYSTKQHPLNWLYRRWIGMHARCASNDSRYGGRGIVVHPRWSDFENFLRDMGVPQDRSLTLDRIDNDKGYGPDNCRWATAKEQRANQRPGPKNPWKT